MDCETRFSAEAAPTGSGKSLIYIAYALLRGGRVAVLTSTKGLQTQLLEDFDSIGLVDIRGRNNYECGMTVDMTCEDGKYAGCMNPDCPYKAAVKSARAAQLVVTNYTYWMLAHKYAEGLGPFDLLVLDEAHNAPDEVSSVAAVEFSARDVHRLLGIRFPAQVDNVSAWVSWAKANMSMAADELRRSQEQVKSHTRAPLTLLREVAMLDRLVKSVEEIASLKGDWVVEPSKYGYRLEPVWAADYAEPLLFRGIERIVMVSATLMPKTLAMLGIPETEYTYHEYPSTFLASRSPVIWIPTCKINRKTETDGDQRSLWLSRIDQIAGPRSDRKGIIHCVSYKRRDFIMDHSETAHRMMTHDTHNAASMVEMFKHSHQSTGKILVSPAMATGWDFAYDSCEYQIIAKVPFPDLSSIILRARIEHDPDYAAYLMAQSLIQACGRAMRAPDDRAETFIIDDNIRWVIMAYKHLFVKWWRRLYRRMDVIPAPPPRLLSRVQTVDTPNGSFLRFSLPRRMGQENREC